MDRFYVALLPTVISGVADDKLGMAPYGEAVLVYPSSSNITSNGSKSYTGMVDSEWVIGSIPNGGYVLGLILEACIHFQSSTPHIDPLHITAHYLRTTVVGPFTVRVQNVKVGSGFSNLTAELLQDDAVKVTTHLIFGINAPSSRDKLNLTLNPPSPYARRHPLYGHPANAGATVKPLRNTWKFHKRAVWTEETDILAKNHPGSTNRTNSSTVGGGGLEWGSWFEFTDEAERIRSPHLCFLADMCINTPSLLPKSEREGLGISWYPTMVLSIEFKNKIPSPSPQHSSRTVGLYSLGRFMTPPQGKHDLYVEVWTAPSTIGQGQESDNWRDNQICLAVATQMALVLPMTVNEKKGRVKDSKL